MTTYFFVEPNIDWEMITTNKQLKKLENGEIASLLTQTADTLERSDFDAASLQDALNTLLTSTGQKPGTLFSLIRLAVSWAPFSPALNDTLSAIGKESAIARIRQAADYAANH